jgi:protein TonB
MLTFAKPEYPLLARRTKVQGTVILSILVDEQGRATDIKFLKRVEQDVGLNEAAERAARASTWRPATKDGKPVQMWFTLPVPFALE